MSRDIQAEQININIRVCFFILFFNMRAKQSIKIPFKKIIDMLCCDYCSVSGINEGFCKTEQNKTKKQPKH